MFIIRLRLMQDSDLLIRLYAPEEGGEEFLYNLNHGERDQEEGKFGQRRSCN